MSNNEYQKEYNLKFKYKLPFKKFSKSYELKNYINEIAIDRNISVETAIDIYVKIAIDNLDDAVTKLIAHDGVCNRKNKNCIIDYPRNNNIKENITKKRF